MNLQESSLTSYLYLKRVWYKIRQVFVSKEYNDLIKKRRNFYLQFLKSPGDIYFDIGANEGNRIEPLIDLGLKIVAVEPQAKCIDRLKIKFGDKILIIKNGIDEMECVRGLLISNSSVLSTFSRDWMAETVKSGRFKNYSWDSVENISMITLDSLIKEIGIPSFIKIDVEGFELQVLNGLSTAVKYISFEYTVPERIDVVHDCIKRITEIAGFHTVQFNYSIGESMEWALDDWMSSEVMLSEIRHQRFLLSSFGDIYSRIHI